MQDRKQINTSTESRMWATARDGGKPPDLPCRMSSMAGEGDSGRS